MTTPKEFTVVIPRVYTFKEGWGVLVESIYRDENSDAISDIEIEVVRISESRVQVIGGVPCVLTPSEIGVPAETFLDVSDLEEDDTHDLRSRWFATEIEAVNHAALVSRRWKNPKPWESFVRTF